MNRPKPARGRRVRAALLLSLLLTVLVCGFTLPKVEATWWDTDWAYRRSITLTYGSNLVNTQVLLNSTVIATAYSQGKIQSDCDDLRFVDDSNVALAFFTEVCNVTAGGYSLVWVTANVTAPSSTIWMYYGNPGAASASQSWAGNLILMFQTLASGWTRVTALDNRFPYGSATYGSTGGSSTHGHTSGSPSMGNAAGEVKSGGTGFYASVAHTHAVPTVTIGSASAWPAYQAMIYGSLSSFVYDMPTGSVLMMNGSIPSGWSQFAALTGKFPLGAANSTATGTGAHTHPISSAIIPTSNGGMVGITTGANPSAATNHGHGAGSGNTASSDVGLPAHLNVLFVQSSSSKPLLAGMVVMFSALPPQGWTRVSLLDSAFPYGQNAFGSSVVATVTHTHTYSFYTGAGTVSGASAASGAGVASSGHTHPLSGTSGNNDVAWIPPYMTVIFGQRKATLPTVTIAGESLDVTVSYSIVGGGAGYSAPVFHYVYGGVSYNYTLTGTPTSKSVDVGSAWSVTVNPLTGSNASERWYSTGTLSGTVTTSFSSVFIFYHQYLQTLSYSITGSGSGYSGPTYTANRNGGSTPYTLTTTPTGCWYDYQASWAATNPLSGSNSSARWYCTGTVSGTIGGEETHAFVYYLQYYLTMSVYPVGGGTTDPASSGWYDQGTTIILVANPNVGYVWGTWIGGGTGSYSGATNPYDHITMNAPISEQADFTSATTMTVTTTSTSVSITTTATTTTSVATTSTTTQVTSTYTSTYTNTTTMTQTNTFTSGGPPPPPPASVTLMMTSWFGVVNQSHSEVHELMVSESGAISVIITDVKFMFPNSLPNGVPVPSGWIRLNDSRSETCGCYLIVGPGTPRPLHFIVAPGFDVPANNYYSISVELIGRASTGQQLTYQSLAIGVTVYSPYGAPAPVSIQQPILTPTTLAGAAILAIITGAIGVAFRRISVLKVPVPKSWAL